MGKRGPKPVNQDDLEFWYGAWLGVFDGMSSGRHIRTGMDFQAEQALWERLLHATSPDEVKAVCGASSYWLNPKRGATVFHTVLWENAHHFLAAKQDPRWPRSNRPTSRGRQIRFLARSMAGICMGISMRTAQDLLAKKEKNKLEAVYRPICDCGHRERDHKDRGCCKYCSCSEFTYSGGREIDWPESVQPQKAGKSDFNPSVAN